MPGIHKSFKAMRRACGRGVPIRGLRSTTGEVSPGRLAVHDGQQVGDRGGGGAALWKGTPESYVSLEPLGYIWSEARAVYAGEQVGWAVAEKTERSEAGLWHGTATAESWLSLHPAGAGNSHANAVHAGQQVGDVDSHASLWRGTPESWVDLNPTWSTRSVADGIWDERQVGSARGFFEPNDRAILWMSSAASAIDLHSFLPSYFTSSAAKGISDVGNLTYVVGFGYNRLTQRTEALLWLAESIAPTSYNMFRGSVISGNLASLQNSDNDRLVLRPGAVFSNAEPPIQVILNAIAPSSSPGGFSFSLESNASIPNAEQKISLWNFKDEVYEVLDTRLATTSDDTVTVNVTTNTARFIQPLTMAIRARVSYGSRGPTFVYPWLARIDKAWWTFPG